MILRRFLPILILLTALTLVSCSAGTTPVVTNTDTQTDNSVRELQWTFGEDTVVDIIAGKNMYAGELTVSNDYEYLYFDIDLFDGWMMSETHLSVVNEYADFPMNKKGTLVPGHFEYSDTHDPMVNDFQYMVPLGDWGPGDTVAFALHLVVWMGEQEETAWGGCYEFDGKRWGSWCEHTITECEVSLPECLFDYQAKYYHPGVTGYWDVELFNVPDGFDVYDGIWPAWCVQQNVYATPNTLYDICLLSTFVDELPVPLQGIDWHAVAWVLNHKDPNATIMDIQHAVWHFTDGFQPTDPESLAMIQDAYDNSEDYWPGVGELMAVMVYSADDVQALFMEVEIGCL